MEITHYVTGTNDENTLVETRQFTSKEEHSEDKLPFFIPVIITICYMLLGILIHVEYDKWDAGNSLYFIFATLSTIGFGDLVPVGPHFVLFWIYTMFGLILIAMTVHTVIISWRHMEKWLSE